MAFWARKAAQRRDPLRCSRCAKLNANGHRQCDACRAYAAEYRARQRARPVTVDAGALAALERRIGSLEHYFARLSVAQRVAYKRGYVAGRRLHRKAQERASYFEALPTVHAQERAEVCHAWRREANS